MRANIATFIVFLLLIIGVAAVSVWYMGKESVETDEEIWTKVTPKTLKPRPIESIITTTATIPFDELDPVSALSLEESVDRVGGFFTSSIEEIYVQEVGQPIEGFEPGMYLSHFPGIRPSDFEGVIAEQGVYRVQDGEVVLDENDEPQHSAGGAITSNGMKTLLLNIAVRTELPVATGSDVDDLLESIR